GDSIELARRATRVEAETIVFCGVHFMAETAKILNPTRRVLLPDLRAGCSLADSVTAEDLAERKARLRAIYPDLAVVGYVNTTADVKAECDACCTSSNAVRVVEGLPSEHILFVPDQNLAAYVQSQTRKSIIAWDGNCYVHHQITPEQIGAGKAAVPHVRVLRHPECRRHAGRRRRRRRLHRTVTRAARAAGRAARRPVRRPLGVAGRARAARRVARRRRGARARGPDGARRHLSRATLYVRHAGTRPGESCRVGRLRGTHRARRTVSAAACRRQVCGRRLETGRGTAAAGVRSRHRGRDGDEPASREARVHQPRVHPAAARLHPRRPAGDVRGCARPRARPAKLPEEDPRARPLAPRGTATPGRAPPGGAVCVPSPATDADLTTPRAAAVMALVALPVAAHATAPTFSVDYV